MCIAGNPSNCLNSEEDEYEYVFQSLKFSYNCHVDDCDEIMTIGLADVSYLSIFNDFDETVTYSKDMFHGWIIDYFSVVTIDSTKADNHESTLGTSTNDLENDTGAHTNLYSGQAEGAFDCLAIPLILVTLLPTLVVLILTMNPVLRMNYFLIVILKRVLMMKLILIVTLVWLRMHLSDYVV